jgi:ferritin
MQDALNAQINAEVYSAYLYWSMSAYFESANLPGFANWMRVQAQEEMIHAMKFYDFVNDRGGRVMLTQIKAPASQWQSPLAAFEAAYKHEQTVTGRINKLVDLALREKDHAANAFLQWFVNEQVEEEASADAVIQKLKLTADAPGGLFMVDKEMGARVFTPPPAEGKEQKE